MRLKSNIASLALLLAWAAGEPMFATSIVVLVRPQGVIIAADERATETTGASEALSGKNDAFCKIIRLGQKMAAAFHGHSGYRRGGPYDAVPEWSAAGEALRAYSVAGDDEGRVAANWGERIATNFDAFYQASPGRVRQLAQQLRGRLLVGFFVGTTAGQPRFFVTQIYLDETAAAVKYSVRSVPGRKLPYASHQITDELIEGDTDRAKLVALEWGKRSKGLPEFNREWRWISFLISQTSEYTQDVGHDVDVLDLATNGSSRWLETHGGCSPPKTSSTNFNQSEASVSRNSKTGEGVPHLAAFGGCGF